MYNKKLFSNVTFPENLKYEDLNTILKVISKSKKITKVDKPLYNYLINENGETQTVDERVFDIFDILNDIIKYFSQSNDLIKK